MECLFGITGNNFCILAADKVSARSIVVMKTTEDKTRDLNPNLVMCYSGEPGDTVQFAEYITCNIKFYGIKNQVELSAKAAASFTRRELANSLRSRKPYNVNMLIGGCSETEGPALYWIDYLAAMSKMPFAAHGYGAYFCLSLMDRFYRPDLSLEEAKEILRKCFAEMKKRFIVNFPEFTIKLITSEGIQEIQLE